VGSHLVAPRVMKMGKGGIMFVLFSVFEAVGVQDPPLVSFTVIYAERRSTCFSLFVFRCSLRVASLSTCLPLLSKCTLSRIQMTSPTLDPPLPDQ